MATNSVNDALTAVFSELVDGANDPGSAVVYNSGDAGLVQSLGRLSAADASRSTNGGATIAAHVQHLRFGLSLLNQWAREGGDPFANARWDAAWKISVVGDGEWAEIQGGFAAEARHWLAALAARPASTATELRWLIGSIAHLAYHVGAIRQIHQASRGPKEGTFAG